MRNARNRTGATSVLQWVKASRPPTSMNCAVCSQANPDGARFCQSCGAPMARPSEDPSSLIGQLIGGRYLVTRVIGEGGMGVVYEAEQKMGAHTRKVAIKTLLPSLSRDHTVVSRFYRECGVVAQLEHPNTIRLYDFGETPISGCTSPWNS